MDDKSIRIIEGKVARDIYGSWDDCSPGLYLGSERVESIMREYRGRRVRVTIEILPELDEED